MAKEFEDSSQDTGAAAATMSDDLSSKYDEILGTSSSEGKKEVPGFEEPSYDNLDPLNENDADPRDTSPADDEETSEEKIDDSKPVSKPDEEQTIHHSPASDAAGDAEEEIPDDLVTAARSRGIDDEKIVWYYENAPEVLESLAESAELVRTSRPETGEEKPAKPAEEEAKDEPLKHINVGEQFLDLPDGVGDVVKTLQTALNEHMDVINGLKEQITASSEEMVGFRKSQQANAVRQLDEVFDAVSSKIPELGNLKTLTAPQAASRQFVHQVALAYQKETKCSDQDAFEVGYSALRGRVSEKKLKGRIINDLEKRKKKFSPRPRGGRRNIAPQATDERTRVEGVIGEHLDKMA